MILIGLGANLPSKYGSPEQTLQEACKAMRARGLEIEAFSRLWLSAPVPVSDQPWYRNAVARVRTDFAPREVLRLLKQIERSFGRREAARNAPRLLDLDLLAYGDVSLSEEGLELPHPRMMARGFVLYPLMDVAPEWRHPAFPERDLGQWLSALPGGQKLKALEENSLPLRGALG